MAERPPAHWRTHLDVAIGHGVLPHAVPIGPFAVALSDGLAFLEVRATGIAFTAALDDGELALLAHVIATTRQQLAAQQPPEPCADEPPLPFGDVLPFRR